MNSLILWLSGRKILSAFLTLAFFVPNALCHDLVQQFYKTMEGSVSAPVLDMIDVGAMLLLAGGMVWMLLKKLRNPHKSLIVFYVTLSLVLAYASWQVLIAKNVELVHFPQYGLLMIPVFALTMRFGEAVAFVTLLGAADEAYQYLILHRWSGIYDFGDVVLNLVGAGLAASFLMGLLDLQKPHPASSYSLARMRKSTGLLTIASLAAGGLLAYSTGLLQLYPGDRTPPALLLLNRGAIPPGFWQKPLPTSKSFHLLQPGEAVLVVVLLLAVYVWIDFRVEWRANRD